MRDIRAVHVSGAASPKHLDFAAAQSHHRCMPRVSTKVRIGVTLLLAAGAVWWFVTQPLGPLAERIGFQDSGAPLAMPRTKGVDHRFDFQSAWKVAEVPLALRFDPPMGHLVYNAQAFWEMNEKRGGHHTGDDLNGIGGMNSDLGDPVYSVADGLVLYAGEPSSGWGQTLVVAHRTVDGRMLHSMYSHLDRIEVPLGVLVARGQQIGTVGTGNNHYPAHLHFEMRDSEHVDIGAGYVSDALNRIDPVGTLAELRNSAIDDHAPSPLALMLERRRAAWTELEIEGAEHFLRLQKSE